MVLKLSSVASSLKKQEQISYCRYILTFPTHLNFISRSTSSMQWFSSLVKGHQAWRNWDIFKCEISSWFRHILTFPAHLNVISKSVSRQQWLLPLALCPVHHIDRLQYQSFLEMWSDQCSVSLHLVIVPALRRLYVNKHSSVAWVWSDNCPDCTVKVNCFCLCDLDPISDRNECPGTVHFVNSARC